MGGARRKKTHLNEELPSGLLGEPKGERREVNRFSSLQGRGAPRRRNRIWQLVFVSKRGLAKSEATYKSWKKPRETHLP